ncbi:DUF3105 domain-containing protein [Candidatus Microgenomates bacterium]|nr:DUF3105 domain-containing protein [Candidatus Microgenomates bacterium]
MEHGYVVISYNCAVGGQGSTSSTGTTSNATLPLASLSAQPSPAIKPLMVMKVGVTGDMSFFTPQNPPEVEVELPESFKSEDCKKLVENLWDTADDFQRVIVVPRPTLDKPIALTAWGKLLKLQSVDEAQIKDFISVYHNAGPEKTSE